MLLLVSTRQRLLIMELQQKLGQLPTQAGRIQGTSTVITFIQLHVLGIKCSSSF